MRNGRPIGSIDLPATQGPLRIRSGAAVVSTGGRCRQVKVEVPMRMSRLVIALVLGLIGLAWIGQGVGLIGGSAMTGSSFWAVVGVVLVAAAGALVVRERRRSTAP